MQLARDHQSETTPNKELVRDYLTAVEKGDFKRIRSLLADSGRFGRNRLSADDFTKAMRQEAPWKGIHIVKEVHEGDNIALVYEGTNATTGQPLEATEFLTVAGGKISEVRGVIVGGVLTGQGASSFSMSSVVAPI